MEAPKTRTHLEGRRRRRRVNTKRSGTFTFGKRRFVLRRVAFPEKPPAEWFVVDLLEHADQAALSPEDVAEVLARALAQGKFDRNRLHEMAKSFGSRATLRRVDRALRESAS